MSVTEHRVTRLAPSPTGALHLGNARTFLINWALARQNGWRIVLRIEDLDAPRNKPGADGSLADDLAWLGLDWDEGPHYQRRDLAPYTAALDDLRARELIYPCACSRREIALAQSAPQAGDAERRYPGTCRPGNTSPMPVRRRDPAVALASSSPAAVAWRVVVPDSPIVFADRVAGPQRFDLSGAGPDEACNAGGIGDFIVATKAGIPSYQLAVVVDDARKGVTDVVRGDDLLPSAARQLWLYQLLGITPPPRYWHVPLVLDPDGRRMAKRHGATSLADCRGLGVSAERIIGLAASWSGISAERREMTLQEFQDAFKIESLPRQTVTCSEADLAWLTAEAVR